MTDSRPTDAPHALDFDGLRPPSPFLNAEHDAWRRKLRGFIDRHVAPHLAELSLIHI